MSSQAKRKHHFTILIMFVLAAGAGCDGRSSALAKVGDRKISANEFAAYLKHRRIEVRDQAHADRLLKEYIEREALAAAIEEQELLDREKLQVELNEFRKQMLISRYFDRFLSDSVGKDAIAEYYNAHAEEFSDKKAHAAHVLVRTNRRMTEEERKAKRTKVQEAYSRIRAGQGFAKVAEELSEDRVSSGKGGDLGWLKQGSIHPVFSKTVFELEEGEVSEPFETPFGFHIVKILEAPQVIRKPLSAVEGDIRYQLRAQAKEAELERLRGAVDVTIAEGGYEATAASASNALPKEDAPPRATVGIPSGAAAAAGTPQTKGAKEATP